MKDLSTFIDQVLSLPWDTRKDVLSIAERNLNTGHQPSDIYDYIYWRVNLPMNHTMSWWDLFDNSVAPSLGSL